jgi:N-acetylmuramoyl-L-alanine amidase
MGADDCVEPFVSRGPIYSAGAHQVREGESIPTVALLSGHFWQTIWEHPDNASLAEVRKDATTIVPGDTVVVPPLQLKELHRAAGARHVFRRRGVPSRFSLQLLDRGEPRANAPYRLVFDNGAAVAGQLDADGILDVFVDARVSSAVLYVGNEEDEEEFDVLIGRLRPLDAVDGVQQRLRNLGHYHGPIDGVVSFALTEAIRAFQMLAGCTITGDIDAATTEALAAAHDQR